MAQNNGWIGTGSYTSGTKKYNTSVKLEWVSESGATLNVKTGMRLTRTGTSRFAAGSQYNYTVAGVYRSGSGTVNMAQSSSSSTETHNLISNMYQSVTVNAGGYYVYAAGTIKANFKTNSTSYCGTITGSSSSAYTHRGSYRATYTISYANGGYGTAPAAQSKTWGTAITLRGGITAGNTTLQTFTTSYVANGGSSTPSTNTTYNTQSHTFSKWYSSATGSTFAGGASYSQEYTTTMTAQWSHTASLTSMTTSPAISRSSDVTTYNVNYNPMGGTSITNGKTQKTIAYSFQNWYYSVNGGQIPASTTITPSSNGTLTALWSNSTSYSNTTIQSTTKDRAELLGWDTSSEATTVVYEVGDVITPTSDVELYAVWKNTGGLVRIYHNGGWKNYTPYVYNNGTWKMASPYIYNNGTWKASN